MVRAPDPQVLEFIARHDGHVTDLALALRAVVLEEAPQAVEATYGNHRSAVWYGRGPKMNDMFAYIAVAKNHVNLGFCRGASVPDPDDVLEGDGKVMRHVKFRSEADLDRPFVRRYIRAAWRQMKQRS
jgi:hypothetical protein